MGCAKIYAEDIDSFMTVHTTIWTVRTFFVKSFPFFDKLLIVIYFCIGNF